MKKFFLFLFTLLPGLGFSQYCFRPFSTNCWFNSTSYVKISPDGSRFLAAYGSGPGANSNAVSCTPTGSTYKVYTVTATGIAYNSAQSATVGGYPEVSDFTANEGYFYIPNPSGSSEIYFMDSTGTGAVSVGTFTNPGFFQKVEGAPNKLIVRLTTGDQAVILTDNTPGAPSYTTVTLPGGNMSTASYYYHPLAVASATENRIYYVATENEDSDVASPDYRVKIKACKMDGTAATGWTDVVIQRGSPVEMGIRPTDGRIFIRTAPNDHHFNHHGIVVINKDGSLATDMNMTDLSLMGGSVTGDRYDLAFDTNGNIYANVWGQTVPAYNVTRMGLMKFDPKGNLDLAFMRAQLDTYGLSTGTGTNSFDMTDSGIIIKCTAGTGTAYEGQYALSATHINANNEDPSSTYSTNPGGEVLPLFLNSTSNYNTVQFLYNSGRLILPDGTQATVNANCGLATPLTVPLTTAAAGTINCNKTAFIAAPVVSTPSSIAIRVEINVTTAGTFSPVTLSGSGFSLLDPNYTITTTTTGIQTFMIPAKYDGSALTTLDIGAGQAGTCQAAFATNPTYKKKVEIEIWTSENCTFTQVGPVLK